MKKFMGILITSLVISLSIGTLAREVTLTWDPNSEPDISHYVVYWGTTSGAYSNNSGNIGPVTTYKQALPEDEQVYYFAVTAVDESGLESDYSNEVNTLDSPSNGMVVDAGPNQTVEGGATVNLDGSNSIGDIVLYQWSQISGTSVVLVNPSSPQPSFTAPLVADTLVFQLIIVNSENTAVSDTCTVTVSYIDPEVGKAPEGPSKLRKK